MLKNLKELYQNVESMSDAEELIREAALKGWVVGIVPSNNRLLVEE